MPIATTCPKCQALFRLPDELAGRKVKCQKCAAVFEAPMGVSEMTMPGTPVAVESEPALVEELQTTAASAAPPPAFALPPLLLDAPAAPPRDDFAADDHYRDSPPDPPPAPPEKSGDDRPAPRNRRVEKPKDGSSKVGVVLGVLGLLLLAFITCSGATGIWWAVRTDVRKHAPVAKEFRKNEFKEFNQQFNNPPFANPPFQPVPNDGFNGRPIQSRPDFDGFKKPEPPLMLQGVSGFIARAIREDGKQPAPPPEGPPGSIRIVFDAQGKFRNENKITLTDPLTVNKTRHKLYIVRLEVGYTYQFDMTSLNHFALDPHLFLRDAKQPEPPPILQGACGFIAVAGLKDGKGTLVKENDDILMGQMRDSRLIYTPRETGIYHLEATYWQPLPGQQGAPHPVGPYTLIVRHVK